MQLAQHYRQSGYVWLASGLVLAIYAALGLSGVAVPGIEEMVKLLAEASGWEFMLAGFLAILLEGLYIAGNLFPGTSAIMILALFASIGSFWQFVGTISAIFFGWCLAGVINILLAYRSFQAGRPLPQHVFLVHDNITLTWLPVFRANYEVSQIAAGGDVWQVLRSALRVRLVTTIILGLTSALATTLVDLESLDNDRGFLVVLFFVVVMFYIAYRELRKAHEFSYATQD